MMKFSMKWGKRSRAARDGDQLGPEDIFENLSIHDWMQVSPYMIDAPPRRRGLAAFLLPSRRPCFHFRRHRHQVLPSELPSYETMLRLDENNPKRAVKSSVLNKLPTVAPEGPAAAEGCLICLESFAEGSAKELPCSHVFCKQCIGVWLCQSRSCPVCRFEFSDKETHLIIPK